MPARKSYNAIKLIFKHVRCVFELDLTGSRCGPFVYSCDNLNEWSDSIKCGAFLDRMSHCQILSYAADNLKYYLWMQNTMKIYYVFYHIFMLFELPFACSWNVQLVCGWWCPELFKMNAGKISSYTKSQLSITSTPPQTSESVMIQSF
jgi:hypothetical protein